MKMDMLCVQQCGTSSKQQKVKDIDGTEYTLKKGEPIFLANVTFSLPNVGVIMTRAGHYIGKTEGCNLTKEEIVTLLPLAKEKLDKGKEGELNLNFIL